MHHKILLALSLASVLGAPASAVYAEGDEDKKPEPQQLQLMVAEGDEEKKPESPQFLLAEGDEEKKPESPQWITAEGDEKEAPKPELIA
ncbi:MAG TPA: hypothetical protein VNK67_13670 [Burkholderiales bacterium]|nr:hypothetical protein [Burkholderiales bacterium]